MEEDEIDRLKLPVARKKAKEEQIDISNLKNITEIRCSLKRHLLKDRKTRDEVSNNSTFCLPFYTECLVGNGFLIYSLKQLLRRLLELQMFFFVVAYAIIFLF